MADRKFADWEWRGHGKVLKVEVRMKWGTDKSDGKKKHLLEDITNPENAPTFFIKRDDDGLFIDLEHGNITELGRMLREHLEGWYAIEWTRKLVVTVRSTTSEARKSYDDYLQKTSFSMRVEEWSEGTQPKTGAVWSRREGRVGYLKKKYGVDIREAMKQDREWERITLGILDDTPENRQALEEIEAKIVELSRMLQQFLSGEQLKQTLANAAIQNLLPQGGGDS